MLLSSKNGYAGPYPNPSGLSILLEAVAIADSKEKFSGANVLDTLPLTLSQSSTFLNPRIFLSRLGLSV